MLSFSSIHWTSPLFVQLRSSPSVMPLMNSGRSTVRLSLPLLTHTSPILHGSYNTLYFKYPQFNSNCVHSLLQISHVIFVCSQRTNTPRKQGGLGTMKIPLVSDTRRTISTDYGVLKEDEGIAYRWV